MNESPPPQPDLYHIVIEAIVAVVLVYFCWGPLENIIGPIVDATLGTALRASGL